MRQAAHLRAGIAHAPTVDTAQLAAHRDGVSRVLSRVVPPGERAPRADEPPAPGSDEGPAWGSDEDDDGVTGILPPADADLGDEAEHDRADADTAPDARSALTAALRPSPPILAPEVVPLDATLAAIAANAGAWPTVGSGVLGLDAWREVAAQVRQDLTPAQARDFDAKAESMSPATREVLGLVSLRQRERKPEAALMTALVVLALVVAAILVVRYLAAAKEANESAAKRAAAAPSSATPKERPPYNPDIHGSVDAYRARYGDATGPAYPIGLDASAPRLRPEWEA